MTEQITYYAIVAPRATREDPAGIARRCRRLETGGFRDEALGLGMIWHFTPVIVGWERAESTDDLVEISEEDAQRLIEHLRVKWEGL